MDSEVMKQQNEGIMVGDDENTEKLVKSENAGEPGKQFRGKRGGVIPAKRRLVKKMVLDSIVKSVASVFRSRSSSSTTTTTPTSSNPNN
ncbi:hypothetical protein TIFTF001_014691 [Ficus carica]|uniref:Uncharacterized protein n=1 Tax=Ficus carica TaxID=3494 RepID=A0AA88A6I4_FICCA|nr:hypothetical protein TIFTF001_014691 [Ficus carica]